MQLTEAGEVFGQRRAVATQYRSTWIVASLEGLRAAGYYPRYREALRSHHDELESCIANTWVPMEWAWAHYEACDQLGIGDSAYVSMSQMGAGVRRKWLARIIAAAEKPDATPWVALPGLETMWQRTVNGGTTLWSRVADDEALLEYDGCELLEIPYYRRGVRLMAHMLISRTCSKLAVTELPDRRRSQVVFRLTWNR